MTKLQYSIKKPEMEWNEMEVEQSEMIHIKKKTRK